MGARRKKDKAVLALPYVIANIDYVNIIYIYTTTSKTIYKCREPDELQELVWGFLR